jgi:hypothetical protein
MTRAEFLAWREFYRMFPFDDRHRYHRPAALVSASLSTGVRALSDRLEWLVPEPVPPGYDAAEVRSLRAFGIAPPPRKVKG